MKILFVVPEYPPHAGGGIATFYRSLLPEFIRQGHQVHVLVSNALSAAHPSYQADGLTVEFIDQQKITANLRNFDRYRAIPELQRHLTNAWLTWNYVDGGKGYDIVETTDWGLSFVPWIISSDSPPTVVQLHASIGQIDFCDPQLDNQLQGSLIRLLETSLLSHADELQANSRSNAHAWSKLIQRSINYIPPALRVLPTPTFAEKIPGGLVVGRIQYWKGPTILCEALQLLGEKAPTFNWLGRDTLYQNSGSSMSSYLKRTYPEIWESKISLLGTLSPEDTLERQAKSEFMVVPSIWDVFNYACVEGMGQSQIVLCSEGAGASDLITSGANGMTFASGDPEALAGSLEALLSLSKAQTLQMGQAARHTVETALAPAKIAQQRIEAYENLLQRGRCSVRPNSWLIDAVSPKQPLDNPLGFLDYLPLRDIASYVIQRSLNKIKK